MNLPSTSFRKRLRNTTLIAAMAAVSLAVVLYLAERSRLYEQQGLEALARQADVYALVAAETLARLPSPTHKAISFVQADSEIAETLLFDPGRQVHARVGTQPIELEKLPGDWLERASRRRGAEIDGLLLVAREPPGMDGYKLVLAQRKLSWNGMLAREWLLLSLLVAVCALSMALLSRLWATLLWRPLSDLADVAGQVSVTGDFSLRAAEPRDPELKRLTRTFNRMLEEVETRDEELRTAHGELSAWVAELKELQDRERDLQVRLERSERMESLGFLAGGVAHDLNNILGPIVGYPDLIAEHVDPDSPQRRWLMVIKQSAQRAAAVIQDLLTLSRRSAWTSQAVRIPEVVQSCSESTIVTELQERFPGVKLVFDVNEHVRPIEGSGAHLTQVVVNLLANAFDATGGSGHVSLVVRPVVLEEDVVGYEPNPAGTYSMIEVSDSGPPIDADDLGRIFEPFYATRKLGRSGTGLGLAVVWGVVRDMGGCVDVLTGHPSEGTTFRVYLPTLEGVSGVLTLPRPTSFEGEEKILVVDDEPEQRELAASLLGDLGYAVEAVCSGREAIEWLGEHDADVVILDMVMEEDFDGLTTLRHILRRRPAQRCVIASGFSQRGRIAEALDGGARQYVPKPYTRAAIGEAVRRALDEQPEALAVV